VVVETGAEDVVELIEIPEVVDVTELLELDDEETLGEPEYS
jgi:hypothetical protein